MTTNEDQRPPRFGERARRVAGTAVTTGSAVTAVCTNSPLAYVLAAAALAVVTLTAFVVLPAVWSRQTERRDSAFSVLRLLLGRDNFVTPIPCAMSTAARPDAVSLPVLNHDNHSNEAGRAADAK